MKEIKIFDTTLRDGEQSPGCSMNLEEKIEVAKQLERLGVDVIEAGFAVASDGDFESIQAISKVIENSIVASLARSTKGDIKRAYEAVKHARYPRIHTFIATSDIHLEYKLKKSREEVIKVTDEMVRYAKSFCEDIEFSCEDATRTDLDYMCDVIETAINAGATTINIPDTVGYTTPEEYFDIITYIKKNTKGIDKVAISVHCHNDLGLAVANSLSAIKAGADQVECTVNGIGERAGNAALEEIVMALKTRPDFFEHTTNINTKEIMKSSKLISYITGVNVQPNKAIVGDNAFAHESGIHQHGVLNNRETYEIMTPESIGLADNNVVLGKHSGKHAFKDKLVKLGFDLSESEIEDSFVELKKLLDKKKEVFDEDIIAIVHNETIAYDEVIKLNNFSIHSGNTFTSSATISIDIEGETHESVEIGDGPIDAAFKAIQRIVGLSLTLKSYNVHSVTRGKDAQGEAIIKVMKSDIEYTGRGLSTDVIEASILAYIAVSNKIIHDSVVYNVMKDYIEDTKKTLFESIS